MNLVNSSWWGHWNIPGELGQYHGCWCLGTLQPSGKHAGTAALGSVKTLWRRWPTVKSIINVGIFPKMDSIHSGVLWRLPCVTRPLAEAALTVYNTDVLFFLADESQQILFLSIRMILNVYQLGYDMIFTGLVQEKWSFSGKLRRIANHVNAVMKHYYPDDTYYPCMAWLTFFVMEYVY